MKTLKQLKQDLRRDYFILGYYEQGIKRYKVTDIKQRKVLKFNSLEELKKGLPKTK
jgi:UDP-2,3-diacylglucosamine pyrophosphatase LpxH